MIALNTALELNASQKKPLQGCFIARHTNSMKQDMSRKANEVLG